MTPIACSSLYLISNRSGALLRSIFLVRGSVLINSSSLSSARSFRRRTQSFVNWPMTITSLSLVSRLSYFHFSESGNKKKTRKPRATGPLNPVRPPQGSRSTSVRLRSSHTTSHPGCPLTLLSTSQQKTSNPMLKRKKRRSALGPRSSLPAKRPLTLASLMMLPASKALWRLRQLSP